jgi:DNA modification methylase
LERFFPLTPNLKRRMKPGAGDPNPKGKSERELRRGREFDQTNTIQSQLPQAEAPHSRRYAAQGADLTAKGIVDARAAPVTLEAAVDHMVCGNAAAVLEQLPSDWCACAITSPPYWNTVDYGVAGQIGLGSYEDYLNQLDRVWAEVARVLLPNGKLCLNVPLLPLAKDVSEAAFGPTHTRMLVDLYADLKQRIEGKTPLRLFSLYVWEKQTTEKMFGSYPFPPNLYERNYIEFIAVFVKPGAPRVLPAEVKERSRLTQEQWMDLTQQIWWMYPENVPRLEGHPAPFPEALPNRLISMYTFRAAPEAGFPGDIVLDPLAGSGTTCIAAKRLERRFVGIDLNPDFCAFANERLAMTRADPRVMSGRRPENRPKNQMALGIKAPIDPRPTERWNRR